MDSFDTTSDISALFTPDPSLSPVQGSCNGDDDQHLLVDADTKWNYGGYCII
ncbi:hypothetical protein M405DRAFT_818229, partial [Rhizopogon salebrosus TDB-379]